MECRRRFWAGMPLIIAASPLIAMGQLPEGQPQSPPNQAEQKMQQDQPNVVVTVNGDPITEREIQVTLHQHLQAQQPSGEAQQVDPQLVRQLQPQVINSLIESRLVEQYVVEKGPDVDEQEVESSMEAISEQLAEQGTSLDRFLASRGQTEQSFETRVKGSLAWQKFQQQALSEDKLQQFYQQNGDRFEAEDYSGARQEVAQAYVGQLWQEIVAQMKPEAEIEVAGQQQAPQFSDPAQPQ